MQSIRRKLIVAIMCLMVWTWSVERSDAVIWFGIPAAYWAASVIFNAVIVGGIGWMIYGPRENGSGTRNADGTKITPDGTIGRDATVTWVDLTTTPASYKTHNATVKVNPQDLKNGVLANPTKYPRLKSAIDAAGTGNLGYGDPNYATTLALNGYTFSYNGSQYSITGLGQITGSYSSYPSNAWKFNGDGTGQLVYQYQPADGRSGYATVAFNYKFVKDFPSAVANSPTKITVPTDVYSDYYGEIDDFIKSNPNVMHYVDTANSAEVATAPDYNPPAAPSADQLAAASGASSGLAAADAAYQNYSSNKTPGNYAAWQAALADAQNAAALQDKIKNGTEDAIKDQATGTVDSGTQDYGTNPDAPEKKDILTLIKDNLAALIANSPLLGIFKSTKLDTLSPDSTLTFKLGLGNATKTIDFAPFSGPINVLGSAILAFAHLLAVFILFGKD